MREEFIRFVCSAAVNALNSAIHDGSKKFIDGQKREWAICQITLCVKKYLSEHEENISAELFMRYTEVYKPLDRLRAYVFHADKNANIPESDFVMSLVAEYQSFAEQETVICTDKELACIQELFTRARDGYKEILENALTDGERCLSYQIKQNGAHAEKYYSEINKKLDSLIDSEKTDNGIQTKAANVKVSTDAGAAYTTLGGQYTQENTRQSINGNNNTISINADTLNITRDPTEPPVHQPKRKGVGKFAILVAALMVAGIAFYMFTLKIGSKTDDSLNVTDHAKTQRMEISETETPQIEHADPVNVGGIIAMGRYPQTANGSDELPIYWNVLDIQDDRALVITLYGVDSQEFHTDQEDVDWEYSDIRTWLNGYFFTHAFSDAEKDEILMSTVPADWNPQYAVDPGNDTEDKIFLLSVSEVLKYMPTDADRKCSATPYAEKLRGAWNNGGCWWLLRSPGDRSDKVASTNTDGTIDFDGGSVSSPRGAIRPAMWIKVTE